MPRPAIRIVHVINDEEFATLEEAQWYAFFQDIDDIYLENYKIRKLAAILAGHGLHAPPEPPALSKSSGEQYPTDTCN